MDKIYVWKNALSAEEQSKEIYGYVGCAAGICRDPMPKAKAFFIALYATRRILIATPLIGYFVPTAEITLKTLSYNRLCVYQYLNVKA